MVQFEGKYQLESSENFDEFLKELGVGFILRNLAKTSKPTIEVIRDGDYWVIKTITTLKTTEIRFKIGEEFDEARMDGKTVKTIVEMDGDNKMVQTQKGDKEVKIIREFSENHLKTTCIVGNITSVRIYKRSA
ncbi:fatty acid-binding protein [Dermatophagoides farinae]|uniref:Fatty acid-binding protein n=1 Tax=Dermatophagoides farinae TaxID=6954 RepID=A0A922I806_DERFA|nr:fatty acid-binding protein-like [Dermatophagoides farinae]KAH7641012.1 group 13 mite allergen-like protein [Dermatophagoides farinae]KAH9526666.1 Fabp5p, variant 2 [Dermatophagoides farinae]